ncbi:MAG: hypothetical protein WAX12_20840 [Candidatus Microthrix subdominans]|jgi:hypothetical protein|uniref:DUF7144 family membrane protein n=1 Tax=Candidatus Neomicrothrix sp. TaxID=2719034 RepID=UPI001B63D5A1|nr:hypothetical protein [Candidatus Microthrix sp.]MBP7596169.1 hypothetical protein [Candidatus Microthrix sp.]HMS47181.1 hypothetical protein [Candidatus Microthrix sp.]
MTDTRMTQTEERTGWTGWIYFAGTMLLIGGTLSIIYGFVALFNDNWVVFGNTNAVFLDLTGWGWVHVIIGALIVLSGFGVFTGNVLARTVGVIVAAVSMIANFLWLPVYPFWAIIIIVIDALVIWALMVHGGELRSN